MFLALTFSVVNKSTVFSDNLLQWRFTVSFPYIMKTNNKGSNSQKWKPRIRFIAGIKSREIVQFEVGLYVGCWTPTTLINLTQEVAEIQKNENENENENGQIGKKCRRKRTNGSYSFGMIIILQNKLLKGGLRKYVYNGSINVC